MDEEGKIREVTEDERIHEIDREKLQKILPLFRSINELNPEEYGEYENDGPVQIWHKIYLAVTDSVVPDEMGGEYRRMDAAGGWEPMFAYAHALFADTEELPALPADGVTYDANAVMTSEGRTTETGCIFELMENTYTAAGEAPQFVCGKGDYLLV